MNVAKWMNYYSFDVMGDLTFGKPFDMLKNGREHFAIELLNGGEHADQLLSGHVMTCSTGMAAAGSLGHVPW